MQTLPGTVYTLGKDDSTHYCEHHVLKGETVLATKKIQGETDSFGCEWIYLCQSCMLAAIQNPKPLQGECDFCGYHATLEHYRDPEEGSAGRVYEICEVCRVQENDRYSEELNGD